MAMTVKEGQSGNGVAVRFGVGACGSCRSIGGPRKQRGLVNAQDGDC